MFIYLKDIFLKCLGYQVRYLYVHIVSLCSLCLVLYLEYHNQQISTIMRQATKQAIHIHILYYIYIYIYIYISIQYSFMYIAIFMDKEVDNEYSIHVWFQLKDPMSKFQKIRMIKRHNDDIWQFTNRLIHFSY